MEAAAVVGGGLWLRRRRAEAAGCLSVCQERKHVLCPLHREREEDTGVCAHDLSAAQMPAPPKIKRIKAGSRRLFGDHNRRMARGDDTSAPVLPLP